MTSKLQVTIPKEIARRYGIEPGTDVEWLPAGEATATCSPSAHPGTADRARRLQLFDAARLPACSLAGATSTGRAESADRGWTRDDLYDRRPG